jgi:glycosyltransferase involved in cell wall biosynthesis
MKFTIYTPFYNYIDAADDLSNAIINQTYSEWEWLITDDLSENLEVSKKLEELKNKDSRIKIIKTNWKKQYYYNIPVEFSSGDIIVKIDSDDIPSPKLLEVYKYNYEKFPDVISIGASSLFKNNVHTGSTVGCKYINYGKSSNYFEASSNKVYSVIGDARSYKINALKNNGVFVSEFDEKYQRGEDIHKSILIEEWGKFFAVPRILYYYTIRPSSNSGGATINSLNDETKKNTIDKKISESKLRHNRELLISIEKYYDSSFDHFKIFYFSGLDSEIKHSNIEYWSDNLYSEDVLKINELYYDHNIKYNQIYSNPDYIIINAVNNLNILDEVFNNRKINNSIVTITSLKENKDFLFKKIKSLGLPFWFNIFNYLTIKIYIK